MPVRFRPPPLLSSKFFYLYLYPAIVFSMTDINDMLNEAEHGKKGNYVEGKITPEAEPFWIALKNRVIKDKVKMRPYVVSRLLEDNFGIVISESAMRRYLQRLEKESNA